MLEKTKYTEAKTLKLLGKKKAAKCTESTIKVSAIIQEKIGFHTAHGIKMKAEREIVSFHYMGVITLKS